MKHSAAARLHAFGICAFESEHGLGFATIIKTLCFIMVRKLKSGEYRLYSRKKTPKTGRRRNLGTFSTLAKAKEHERAVEYFKRHKAA
jgi:hypothetical protein